MTTATENWFKCPVPTADGAVDIYLDPAGRWFMDFPDGPEAQDWETALLMIPIASRELPKQIAEDRFADRLKAIVEDLAVGDLSSGGTREALTDLVELLPQLRDWLIITDRLTAVSPQDAALPDGFEAQMFSFEDGHFIFTLRSPDGWGEMKSDEQDPTTDFQTIPCSLSDAVDFTDGSDTAQAPLLRAHDQLLAVAVDLTMVSVNRIRAGVRLEAPEFLRLGSMATLAEHLAIERSAVA